MVAAADGAVADIVEIEETEVLKTRTRRVGIFLSVFDVHTNRAPIDGRVIYRRASRGTLPRRAQPNCSEKNEAMTWAFENPRVTLVVRQLTGAIARRIVGWSKVGDELKKGERFGMIRFGSRTEVYLPLNADVLVKVGDRVSGGSTVDCATCPNNERAEPKIYLLPNLMTAGNLFCGFAAALKILEGALLQASNPDAAGDLFHAAIWFILGACIFDLLDGRLARLGGHESAFGREFDSLADIVSFGVAPALMVYQIVLQEFPRACWMIAFVYLACGALRLARFNCVVRERMRTAAATHKNFTGFPDSRRGGTDRVDHAFHALAGGRRASPRPMEIRSAAADAFSVVHDVQPIPLSEFQGGQLADEEIDPAFSDHHPGPRFHGDVLRMDAGGLFLAYLLYGFLRPWLSREWRREIEEEIGEDEGDEPIEQVP